jgi:hypothetical protein
MSYPELIYVMCVVHAVLKVHETICVLHPNVDKLLADGNKIFVKWLARTELQIHHSL